MIEFIKNGQGKRLDIIKNRTRNITKGKRMKKPSDRIREIYLSYKRGTIGDTYERAVVEYLDEQQTNKEVLLPGKAYEYILLIDAPKYCEIYTHNDPERGQRQSIRLKENQ